MSNQNYFKYKMQYGTHLSATICVPKYLKTEYLLDLILALSMRQRKNYFPNSAYSFDSRLDPKKLRPAAREYLAILIFSDIIEVLGNRCLVRVIMNCWLSLSTLYKEFLDEPADSPFLKIRTEVFVDKLNFKKLSLAIYQDNEKTDNE